MSQENAELSKDIIDKLRARGFNQLSNEYDQDLASRVKIKLGQLEKECLLFLLQSQQNIVIVIEQAKKKPAADKAPSEHTLQIIVQIDSISQICNHPQSPEILTLKCIKKKLQGENELELRFQSQKIMSKWKDILQKLRNQKKDEISKENLGSFSNFNEKSDVMQNGKKDYKRSIKERYKLMEDEIVEGQIKEDRNRLFFKKGKRAFQEKQNQQIINQNLHLLELINHYEGRFSKIRQKIISCLSFVTENQNLNTDQRNQYLKLKLYQMQLQSEQFYKDATKLLELRSNTKNIVTGIPLKMLNQSQLKQIKSLESQAQQKKSVRKQEIEQIPVNKTQSNLCHSSLQRDYISQSEQAIFIQQNQLSESDTLQDSYQFIHNYIKLTNPQQQEAKQPVFQQLEHYRQNHSQGFGSQNINIDLRVSSESEILLEKQIIIQPPKQFPCKCSQIKEKLEKRIGRELQNTLKGDYQLCISKIKEFQKKLVKISKRCDYYQLFFDLEKNIIRVSDQTRQDKIMTFSVQTKSQIDQFKEKFNIYESQNQKLRQDVDIAIVAKEEYKQTSIRLQRHITYFYHFQGKVLREKTDLKIYLKQEIERYTEKQIESTQRLFALDKHNATANYHTLVDQEPYIVLLIQTQNKELIAGFSQSPISKLKPASLGGMIVSLSKRRVFPLIQGRKSVIYQEFYLMFGNSEIRIRPQTKKLFSNFGVANSNYNSFGQRFGYLLGEGDNKNQVDLATFEIHKINFKE